ncbi:MAG: hypothetical protein Q8S73_04590 [Deltaproteobacteria bacterium]|nr:hypothetical protein [Myxococcales bacterium]MDP3213358.1 hypothetical protein [Deltaproteobacteria bacterium]
MAEQQQQQGSEAAAEHTGVAAVVDEVKERFTREWDSLKHHAKAAFSQLTEEDLESVKGRFDELRLRVVKAYGYAEQHAHDEITRLLHRAPASGDAAPKATSHAPAGGSRKKQRGGKRHARAARSNSTG